MKKHLVLLAALAAFVAYNLIIWAGVGARISQLRSELEESQVYVWSLNRSYLRLQTIKEAGDAERLTLLAEYDRLRERGLRQFAALLSENYEFAEKIRIMPKESR